MPQKWTYYIPMIVQQEGKLGFCARIVELDHAINSEETVWALIEKLTVEILGSKPEDIDDLPLMPITWTLISAKQGTGVNPKGNGKGKD